MNYIHEDGNFLIERVEVDMKVSVARQFVYYRKLKGLTQEELAKRAGTSRTNITRFESGSYNPSVEMMVRIATALGVRLNITLEE